MDRSNLSGLIGAPSRYRFHPRGPLTGAVGPVLPVASRMSPWQWRPRPSQYQPYGPGGIFPPVDSVNPRQSELQSEEKEKTPVPLVGLYSPSSRFALGRRPSGTVAQGTDQQVTTSETKKAPSRAPVGKFSDEAATREPKRTGKPERKRGPALPAPVPKPQATKKPKAPRSTVRGAPPSRATGPEPPVLASPAPVTAPTAVTLARPGTPAPEPSSETQSIEKLKHSEEDSDGSDRSDESNESDRSKTSAASSAAPADLSKRQVWLVVGVTVLVGAFVGMFVQQSFRLSQPLLTPVPEEMNEVQRNAVVARHTEEPYVESEHESILGPLSNGSSFALECGSDACVWQAKAVAAKVNATMDPCQDFYAHVCTTARSQAKTLDERPYKTSGAGHLMKQFASLLIRRRSVSSSAPNKGFLDQSTLFLRSCLNVKAGKELAKWDSIRRLLRSLGVGAWPYHGQPSSPFEAVLIRTDKTLGLFPVVRVWLKKRLENEGYLPVLDAPQLTLVRLLLLQPEAGLRELRAAVRTTMTLWKNVQEAGSLAQEVAHLEADLAHAAALSRGKWSDAAVSLAHLPRVARLKWQSYLPALFPGANSTLVAHAGYLARLSELLAAASSRTLFNYVGYRVLVFLSPLLPPGGQCCGTLIPLAHDNHLPRLSAQLQGCIHMLEHLFPYGVIKLARFTFGASVEQQEELTRGLNAFANEVKAAVAETTVRSRWLDDAEAAAAARRIKNMAIEFPGADEQADVLASYYPRTSARFTSASLLRDYVGALNATLSRFWRSRHGADWDARHRISCFFPGLEYNAGQNTLYLPLGSVAVLDSAGGPAVGPTLVPLLAPLVVRGMFSAIDPRRPPLGRRWSSDALNRFRSLELCLLEMYRTPLGRYSWAARPASFMDDMLASHAVLAPTMRAYVSSLSAPRGLPSGFRLRGSNMTAERLFFVSLAASECEDVGAEAALARRKIELALNLPAPLRVNVPLAHSPEFSRVFSCPKGSPMAAPENRCALW